jgi:hypothetical protein
MTAEEIRHLPYLAWRDQWAWMETMRGKRWECLLRTEQRHHQRLLHTPRVKALIAPMEKELVHAQQYLYVAGFQAGKGLIDVTITPESQFQWKWSHHTTTTRPRRKAYDLDVEEDHVWYATETGQPYVNQIICEDAHGKKKWSKSQVSAEVAVVGPYCYYIRTPKDMKTTGLYACDARTGRGERMIYEERNPEHYLGLVKASRRTLYLVSEDPSGSQTYHVDGIHVRPLFRSSLYQMPLGCLSPSSPSSHCALLRRTPYGPWEAHGAPLTEWKLPSSRDIDDIGWVNVQTGHVITLHEGSETLWHCSPHRTPKALLRLKAGSFFYNAWEAWEESPYQRFMIQSPLAPPFLLHAYQDRLYRAPSSTPSSALTDPLQVHKWHATSADGTSVPFVVVYRGPSPSDPPPKAQLVYVYGAYGSTTPVQWPHAYWAPLIHRGWAITYAYVRGGGDRTEEWADAARREHRHRSVDDLDAVLRASQQRLRLTPRTTVLYGRSAGGVPVGALVARWPKGERVGAVFTEVPYVDVLRTSTNPALPLTVGEFKEFGNPRAHPAEFHELLHVSPINSLPAEGAPGVFVLTRVGLQDKQVLAYESFKWIQRLRGHVGLPTSDPSDPSDPQQKYVTYARDQEHVYRAKVFPRYRAMDLAVLEAWVEGRL